MTTTNPVKPIDRAFLVSCLAVSLLVLAAIILPAPPPEAPVSTWTRSSDKGPPKETPIVGFWISDGQPVTVPVVLYGDTFYEYNPASRYPAPLFGCPPVYWIGFPGGAE
jgi:hypothetical protein